MEKRFIEFLYGGLIVAETSGREATAAEIAGSVTLPKGALAYRFYSKTESFVDGEKLIGNVRDRSGWTYQGRRMSIYDVESEMPDQEILISNMRSQRCEAAVQTPGGRMFPLDAADRVVAA